MWIWISRVRIPSSTLSLRISSSTFSCTYRRPSNMALKSSLESYQVRRSGRSGFLPLIVFHPTSPSSGFTSLGGVSLTISSSSGWAARGFAWGTYDSPEGYEANRRAVVECVVGDPIRGHPSRSSLPDADVAHAPSGSEVILPSCRITRAGSLSISPEPIPGDGAAPLSPPSLSGVLKQPAYRAVLDGIICGIGDDGDANTPRAIQHSGDDARGGGCCQRDRLACSERGLGSVIVWATHSNLQRMMSLA